MLKYKAYRLGPADHWVQLSRPGHHFASVGPNTPVIIKTRLG